MQRHGRLASCGRSSLEEGVETSRTRTYTSVQAAEAGKQISRKCWSVRSFWGKRTPCNLVALGARCGVLRTEEGFTLSTAEERHAGDGEGGQVLTLGLQREEAGLEEFMAWVENRTLSAKH